MELPTDFMSLGRGCVNLVSEQEVYNNLWLEEI